MAESEEQPTHFEYIVIGTGLRESILAAALAKSGRSVLHIDEQPYYGSSQATLSLQELVQWSSTASKDRYRNISLSYPSSSAGAQELSPELAKASRQYNLSLSPTLITAVSPFVNTLVRSGVAKYSGFKLLDAVAILEGGALKRTAATKEDTFNDKTLSLVDKRKLVNFIKFATGQFEDSEHVTAHGQEPFLAFLEDRFSLKAQLRDTIAYAAALSSSSEDTTVPALTRIRKYLSAVGRFGRSPFLIAQYGGIGEIIQGFCRVCAVFGGTYMLGRPITNVIPATAEQPAKVEIDGQETYTADCLIREGKNTDSGSRIHRAIIVLSERIKLQLAAPAKSEDDDEDLEATPIDAGNALFVIPPGSLGRDTPRQPVTALMAGDGTFSAPKGQYVLYLSSVSSGSGEEAKGVLEPCLNALLAASAMEESALASVQLASLYYSESSEAPLEISQKGKPLASPAAVESSSTAGHLSLAEVCDSAVEQAQAVFEQVTGETELFEAVQEDLEATEDD